LGRIREAENEHARVSFRYNSLGLPVEERCDEHLIERSYDKHGLIVSLRSSLGAQLSYERNAYGELIRFRADHQEPFCSGASVRYALLAERLHCTAMWRIAMTVSIFMG